MHGKEDLEQRFKETMIRMVFPVNHIPQTKKFNRLS
jgi:hypothetical protein